jgi:hypothetical protein
MGPEWIQINTFSLHRNVLKWNSKLRLRKKVKLVLVSDKNGRD